jgi:hypothetical protein
MLHFELIRIVIAIVYDLESTDKMKATIAHPTLDDTLIFFSTQLTQETIVFKVETFALGPVEDGPVVVGVVFLNLDDGFFFVRSQ